MKTLSIFGIVLSSILLMVGVFSSKGEDTYINLFVSLVYVMFLWISIELLHRSDVPKS